ncbi:hypothetical protein [Streptomyces sp. UG1]|uniref:hypothetical protein n=1 Tax=Streptomyces sp. UG1 TaxID=3417652 RepID=UPI003CE7F111
MSVGLLPPVTTSCGRIDAEPLTEGPRFVRTRAMTRWHRPRSGRRYVRTGRTVYDLWCGGGYVDDTAFQRDEPLAGEPVCGTCDGRAVGAGQEPDGPSDRELLFSPRWIDPPKNCPGSRSTLFAEMAGGRVGRCLVCGDHQPLRAMGGPYDPRYGIVQHPTGAALVAPCPFHRWRYLTVVDGCVACGCGRPLDAPARPDGGTGGS